MRWRDGETSAAHLSHSHLADSDYAGITHGWSVHPSSPEQVLPAPTCNALGELCLSAKKQHAHHHPRFHDSPPAEAYTAKMGLMDYMEDLYASLTWREVEAEAPESGMCCRLTPDQERIAGANGKILRDGAGVVMQS